MPNSICLCALCVFVVKNLTDELFDGGDVCTVFFGEDAGGEGFDGVFGQSGNFSLEDHLAVV